MSRRFEELAWAETPMGLISLRRRLHPSLEVDVYEVKLDDEFLMSSLFTVAEVQLARLALAQVSGSELDVLVGGLGLGFTARAVLADPRVRSLTVVEALDEVIDWHRRGLLPGADELTSDPRTTLVADDFFARMNRAVDADDVGTDRRFWVILVDIDHSPRHVLHPSHAAFYEPDRLRRVAAHLRPGGVFALWSDDPPDDAFQACLGEVFATAAAHVVTFHNVNIDGLAANTVYLATVDAAPER